MSLRDRLFRFRLVSTKIDFFALAEYPPYSSLWLLPKSLARWRNSMCLACVAIMQCNRNYSNNNTEGTSHLHTHIIEHFNLLARIMDMFLTSLRLTVLSLLRMPDFWVTFHGHFIYSQSFCQNFAERKLPKIYVVIVVNMSTHELLDHTAYIHNWPLQPFSQDYSLASHRMYTHNAMPHDGNDNLNERAVLAGMSSILQPALT